jgi:hypothetical protein
MTERPSSAAARGLPWPTAIRIVSAGSAATIVAEIILVTLVAAAVVFFVGLVVKRPSDGAVFFARAAFEAYVDSPMEANGPPSGSITVFPAFPVVPAPKAGGTLASTPLLETVELVLVSDVPGYVRDVLGANAGEISAGEVSDVAAGVLIDEDTALRLGVKPGDQLVLNALVLGGDRVATATVVGLIAPYVRPTPDHSTGLVVFPATEVDDRFVVDMAALLLPDAQPWTRTYGVDPADPRATVRNEVVTSFVLAFFALDRLVALLGIAAFGGAMWVAVAGRVIGRAVQRAAPAVAVLVALGEVPARAGRASVAVPLAALLVGQVAGVVVVASAVFPLVLRVTLQPATFLPILVVLGGLSTVLIVLAGRVVQHAVGPSNLIGALSGGDES